MIDLSAVWDNTELFENFEGYLPLWIRSIINDNVYMANLRKKGLTEKYREKFFKARYFNSYQNKEDLIEFILKHPEFSDILILKKKEKRTIGDMLRTGDYSDSIIDCFLVDDFYRILFKKELIRLDDFVPPQFLSPNAKTERERWLKENDNQKIIEYNREYEEEYFNTKELRIPHDFFVIDVMKNFISKYPEYSQLISDYNAFNQYYEKLKKELEVE